MFQKDCSQNNKPADSAEIQKLKNFTGFNLVLQRSPSCNECTRIDANRLVAEWNCVFQYAWILSMLWERGPHGYTTEKRSRRSANPSIHSRTKWVRSIKKETPKASAPFATTLNSRRIFLTHKFGHQILFWSLQSADRHCWCRLLNNIFIFEML